MKLALFTIGFVIGVLLFQFIKWLWTADTKKISEFNQEDDI